jgi:hypothetical protein
MKPGAAADDVERLQVGTLARCVPAVADEAKSTQRSRNDGYRA